MNLIRWSFYNQLKEHYSDITVSLTFGYITKYHRIQAELPKAHYIDARMITGNILSKPAPEYWLEQKIRRHNRSLHKQKFVKGHIRQANQTPYVTRGFRRYDLVQAKDQRWYINGRRLKGAFVLKQLSSNNVLNITPTKIKLIAGQFAYLKERKKHNLPD